MHTHHVLRGGLLALGVGAIVMSITASVGAGSPGASAAPAAGRAEVTVSIADASVPVASLRSAPAATPVLIEVTAPPVEAAEPDGNEPDRPVVHAGPGPATPVEGATTLIDPLVSER
jgi:hypothetical protein